MIVVSRFLKHSNLIHMFKPDHLITVRNTILNVLVWTGFITLANQSLMTALNISVATNRLIMTRSCLTIKIQTLSPSVAMNLLVLTKKFLTGQMPALTVYATKNLLTTIEPSISTVKYLKST